LVPAARTPLNTQQQHLSLDSHSKGKEQVLLYCTVHRSRNLLDELLLRCARNIVDLSVPQPCGSQGLDSGNKERVKGQILSRAIFPTKSPYAFPFVLLGEFATVDFDSHFALKQNESISQTRCFLWNMHTLVELVVREACGPPALRRLADSRFATANSLYSPHIVLEVFVRGITNVATIQKYLSPEIELNLIRKCQRKNMVFIRDDHISSDKHRVEFRLTTRRPQQPPLLQHIQHQPPLPQYQNEERRGPEDLGEVIVRFFAVESTL
jgi:hypothetical protein